MNAWAVVSVDLYAENPDWARDRASVVTGYLADVLGVEQVHRPTVRLVVEFVNEPNLYRYEASVLAARSVADVAEDLGYDLVREGVVRDYTDIVVTR